MPRKNFMWSGDCSDASENQRSSKRGWSDAAGVGEISQGLQGECGPADTSTADSQPPEPRNNPFLF